jgi:lipopolysaccharide assembly outer membrane protein LptD (OstA)
LLRFLTLIFFLLPFAAQSQTEQPLILEHSDIFEIIRGAEKDTIYISGNVRFRHQGGKLEADSAIWVKGEIIILNGNVTIQDTVYQLQADRVRFYVRENLVYASGKKVIITSFADSIQAIGTNAYYSRDSALFRMLQRPTVFLNYPDSARLVQVDADRVAFDANSRIAYADGDVVITQEDTESRSGRAIMYGEENLLLLLDKPTATRRDSRLNGDTLVIFSSREALNRIHVEGNATGNFNEPSGSDSTLIDNSELKAKEIDFYFRQGEIDSIIAAGQAYLFYAPASIDSAEVVKNAVSGDTIKLFIDQRRLTTVQVVGGAEGDYYSGRFKSSDSGRVFVEDTIHYLSSFIDYSITDSTIKLTEAAQVGSKNMSLTAQRIWYNVSRDVVTAYDDSTANDSGMTYIPVVLNDGKEELLGSYLEYSLKSDRGMIWQSRSEYQEAYYRGRELFRERKDVYYVEDGTYTSCDQEVPHFHFQSHRMKMIQDDRIIARPVVFYIEQMPLLIVPYYVFSIKPGRHSGFLPFRIGNFERGAGSITNVGYYWAASEYWDAQASLDYYEDFGFKYQAALRYNVRYKFDGQLSGSYATDSYWSQLREIRNKRWSVSYNHSQTFSPTFNLRANGTFLSDKRYYTDFSTDLSERLNRDLRSQISLSKQWSGASLSAQFLHSVALDREVRTDEIPNATLSIPSRSLFGGKARSSAADEGRKWYQNIYFGYGLNFRNYSTRATDTTGFRSRREFMTVNHSPSLSIAPVAILKYFKFGPSFRYQETWYKIFETDQSQEAGIATDQFYRRYSYGASLTGSTDIYGTVYPRLFGLEGLRHVLTPSVTYSWSPEIKRHEEVRSFTGAGGGGAKQEALSFSLRQLFQAKVKAGETTRNYDLLSVNSSLTYNFEATGRKFSEISTTGQISLLKNVRMSASLTHDLYRPGTDVLRWQSPYLTSFSISSSFSTGGVLEEFDPLSQVSGTPGAAKSSDTKQSWNLSVSHYYSERGRASAFSKIHNISFNLRINLTSKWKISYYQGYDIVRDRTISRRVEVERNLHCWQGYFYWIPDGSNQGYYFRINVISIPDIKFEKSESGIRSAFL